MARVRILLPTYRRPALLPRAVESIRRQTVTDWVCDVHNDDPADDGPARLLAALGDPRFRLVNHPRNLGGAATFNLLFRPVAEPFYTMLEDDNWWEPNFLATMLEAAQLHPEATLWWSNLRIWAEQDDGSFVDTGRLAWPDPAGAPPRRVDWGQPRQALGPLLSHGAALVRSRPGDVFEIPAVPIGMVECYRERLFPYPLVFVPAPLVNFSLTRASARSADRAEWAEQQVILAATFLRAADGDAGLAAAVWDEAAAAVPPATAPLLYAALLEPAARIWRDRASFADWLRCLRGAVRHPTVPWRILRSRRRHAAWWTWLDQHTRRQFARRAGTPGDSPP